MSFIVECKICGKMIYIDDLRKHMKEEHYNKTKSLDEYNKGD